jgi:glycosyltransferase 2 family protein
VDDPLLANVLGNVWSWVSGVFARIGDLSIYWLLLALALKTAESALIGLGWRNILRAAYPSEKLSFRTAWGASQGGTAINAVTPAQAGTAAMIGIFRSSIKGSSVAGVAAATAVQSVFFTAASILIVISVAIFRPRTVSKGSPSDETGGFFAAHPVLIPIIIVAVAVVLYFLWPKLKPRLASTWQNVKQGAAIFRDWRRYLRGVALPSAASYGCRIGVNVVFMAAFGIPVTAFTVFLVASSHMLSGMFAITPGGVGQTQALDVATLRGQAASGDIAAFSITQDSVMTLWNVVLGIVVMLWAFGFAQAKEMLSRKGKDRGQAQEQPSV